MESMIRELVVAAQQGDREAFGRLYEHFAPKLYGYFYYRLNRQPQLAEDLTEEVFVRVVSKLDSYQDQDLPFTGWLYRIAHNLLIDHFRVQSRGGVVSIEDCYELAEAGAEQRFDAVLTHEQLAGAMRALSEGQRQIIVLRFLQGLSVSETAAAAGRSEDAVKKLQARALACLKRALDGARVLPTAA